MPKELIVTALANRIEYATTNGKGLITGSRVDLTEECVQAVMMVMDRNLKSKGKSRFSVKGFGEIQFTPFE